MNIVSIHPSLTVSPLEIKKAHLIEGEVLDVEIKDVLQNGNVKLFLKGIPVEAKAEVALAKGETVKAKVISEGGRVVLKLVSAPEQDKVFEMIKKLLPERASISRLIADILNYTEQIKENNAGGGIKAVKDFFAKVLVEGNAIDEAAVKDIIEKGGQIYEANVKKAAASLDIKPDSIAKLAKDDLKPILMNVIRNLVHGENQDTKKAMEGLLKNIELNQFINTVHAREDGNLYFQVPFYFRGNVEGAEVFFFGNKRAKAGMQDGCGVIVSLDLEGIGMVAADARISGENVSIRIYAEDEGACGFIKGHLNILKEGIESKGLIVNNIVCRVGRKNEFEDLFFKISKTGLIDKFA